jgi:hypothetical protein
MRRSRNIIVVLGVLFLCLCFSPHPALSTEPLDPPFEGAFIENTTDVNVYGNFREKESLIHDQSSGEVVIIIETEEGCGKKPRFTTHHCLRQKALTVMR